MKDDFIYREMEHLGADGVDFVPMEFEERRPSFIYSSFTKGQWEQEKCIPKTNRKYWKFDADGRKRYIKISFRNDSIKI